MAPIAPRSSDLNSIFSLFPADKSESGSDISSSNQTPLDFSPSIPFFFPPYNSPPSSVSSQTKHYSPYSIPLFFPPTQSQANSLSSERPIHELAHSIPSIFLNIPRWQPIKFHISDKEDERIFPQEVEAAFKKACRERWTYAIYWELDWPSSPWSRTFSAAKGFYNVDEDDQKFKDKAVSFFQLRRSWPGSIIHKLFSTSSSRPLWLVGDTLLKSRHSRAQQGRKAGLQTMSWIRVAHGVMEFGSTKVIHQFNRKKVRVFPQRHAQHVDLTNTIRVMSWIRALRCVKEVNQVCTQSDLIPIENHVDAEIAELVLERPDCVRNISWNPDHVLDTLSTQCHGIRLNRTN
nr:hypothetical protein CFP56_06717 [Quercus suber]